ncbi:E3 ubiquitin-protein ligase COP1-like isoform X4 [Daktulosphaira vitifoliae]|uniref:E3 ubiquitin-protein ligase COP1-like isoform X4 n=1 Tax=Daktulosphaira vitifoliae TaxID=58002 RepID=UPI0021AAA750|nr:E3 ubiquitin-protein ligase COP1-like isoform X4 [Daktulosphaira vitifoliae]
MSYPVLLSLCLCFFAAYGIPADNQKEEHDIPADNQNDKPCDIHGEDQNEERKLKRDDRNADQTCSVCWDNYPDTPIGVCTHKFCKGCIDTWKFDKRSYRCPLCNFVYDNPDIQAVVNVINQELAFELFQNFDYIVRNSDYYSE